MKRPATVLTTDQVMAMVRASGDGYTGYRNRAIIMLMWRSGLRTKEVRALRMSDLGLKEQTIHVRNSKRKKSRRVAMDRDGWRYILEWLQRRVDLVEMSRDQDGTDPEEVPVVCTVRPYGDGVLCRPMGKNTINESLKYLAKKAGIPGRVHGHALRHTFAKNLADEGTPMHIIQKALGHSSLQVTSVYVSHVSPREVYDVMRGRSIRGG